MVSSPVVGSQNAASAGVSSSGLASGGVAGEGAGSTDATGAGSALAAGPSWTTSVVIAAFALNRWDALREAVGSVLAQTLPATQTILVIDHNPELLAKAKQEISGVTVIANTRSQGASGARNTGVAASSGDLVAFIDDDAVADRAWLEHLVPHFAVPEVVGVGGRLDPLWCTARPRWFPPEFDWAVGASYRGMPDAAEPVRNVWSGNMVLRRQIFDLIGGFREDFGKVGNVSRPEDTDLCLRAAQAQQGGIWIYEPAGAAGHRVPASRETLKFFMRRCFNEGRGKAALAALNGTQTAMASERSYARRVLPAGIARGLRDVAHGDLSGGARSAALAAGMSAATAGFAAGRIGRIGWIGRIGRVVRPPAATERAAEAGSRPASRGSRV